MKPIPPQLLAKLNECLKLRNVPNPARSDYRKWILYFLDFRSKYVLSDYHEDQVRGFTEKLLSKNQTVAQAKQAAEAVALLFLLESDGKNSEAASLSPAVCAPAITGLVATAPPDTASRCSVASKNAANIVCEPPGGFRHQAPARSGRRYDEWRCLRTTASPAWDMVIQKLAAEIKLRHYSRETLRHYADWSRKFQNFLKDKSPDDLSSRDVKHYLTHLAVKEQVSSSHQNLAFNALLFLFRHILKKDFGDHKDVPRAKKSNYIPTVLSRREIDSVLEHLRHPFKLIAQVQYGCGLRISEACNLRVKDLDFETGILTVRGKGKKVRTVPLPKRVYPELRAQLEAVKKMHDQDLKAGFAGVFLDDQLEKKYPRAPTELLWYWFFPQESLTQIAGTKESRRYHVHDSRVQEELFKAVRKASLTKRVTTHTFRHSFATHLLQANYDIRTIQTSVMRTCGRP